MEVVGAEELLARLPMPAAIDALEEGFRAGIPETPLRSHAATSDGDMLLMPAASPDLGAGVKLITVTAGNPSRGLPLLQGAYVLFSPGTQEPQAVIDGATLTALRTGAISGLATRWLARPDARRAVIFGAGVQARSHVTAMRTVRDVDDVVIVSRTAASAEALAAEVGGRVADAAAVRDADLVCTCTTSATPLFDGSWLREGVHVNAVGAYTTDHRELDGTAVARGRVVVETRDVAMAEAGDLTLAIEEGAIEADHIVADLQDVVRGKEVRRSADDLTIFKSVGMAFEDLVVARAAFAAS